jgi:transcriptional regulator with GAF, ATPase, and Fis domain
VDRQIEPADPLAAIERSLSSGAGGEELLAALAELRRTDAERRRRNDVLEALLPALAGVLDIRDVFREVSRIAQQVLPHDLLGLAHFFGDPLHMRIYAASEPGVVTREFPVPDPIRQTFEWQFFIARDFEIDPAAGRAKAHVLAEDGGQRIIDVQIPPVAMHLLLEQKIRAQLRVPLRVHGEIFGALVFNSRTPGFYKAEDAIVARRIADHVALALSHQRLADEQRRLAEERARTVELEKRVTRLTEELEATGAHRVLGASQKWKDVLAHAAKVAGAETTVLITGESGTGKEVVARFIHRASGRRDAPFVALNCAALPEQLLESELFGHEKGAFTGAVATRVGRMEQAEGGVLFLDEVGEMSPSVQAKFLRVLQEREYQRVGGTRNIKADIRVLAATNRDLKAAIGRGGFREDLYYRLAVFEIPLPPLRERAEDVLVLVDAFLEEIGRSVGRPAGGVSREVRDLLSSYRWPGNVRELRNAIERAVILCEGGLITSEHLPISLSTPPAPVPVPAAVRATLALDDLEKDAIAQALEQAGKNKSKAARLLGVTRAQLYSRLEKHGIKD